MPRYGVYQALGFARKIIVTEEEFKSYVSATQTMLAELNENLRQIREAVHVNATRQSDVLMVSARAQDASYLTIRALAETNVEFRTILLRLAQEPVVNPAAQESRDVLVAALAQHQRNANERPTLRPVPPPGAET
jgi:hypothetical protein